MSDGYANKCPHRIERAIGVCPECEGMTEAALTTEAALLVRNLTKRLRWRQAQEVARVHEQAFFGDEELHVSGF